MTKFFVFLYLIKKFIAFFFKVVDIMRMNVDKVLERDSKLSQLDDRAGILRFFILQSILISLRISFNNHDYHRCFTNGRFTIRTKCWRVKEKVLVEKFEGICF